MPLSKKSRSKADHAKEERVTKEKMSRGMKAKEAAQKRRDNEAIEMDRLSEVLPLTRETVDKLDKGSIIRLAIAYIRIKQAIEKDIEYAKERKVKMGQDMDLDDPEMESAPCNKVAIGGNGSKNIVDFEGHMMAEALQGFVLFINRKGKILFVSSTVEDHLGLKQTMLMGRSVLDIIHQNDHKELGQQFQVKMSQCTLPDVFDGDDTATSRTNTGQYVLNSDQSRVFYVRMKFNMHHNGNKTKHTGFMLVQWSGRLKLIPSPKPRGYSVEGLACVCRPVQTNSILEIRLDGNMFMSRHDLDMKFTFCDPRIITLIGYEPREVIGRTAYYFHNPLDAQKIHNCHSTLIVKGTSVSKYYRFCGKNGDWVWMQTRATIIYNTSNKPQYVVCMNYVIGEEEGQRCLMMEQETPGFSSGESKGFLDLNTHCKSVDSSGDQDTGYSTSNSPVSPANSPLYSSTSSGLSPSTCMVESGDDEYMVDARDLQMSPSYIDSNSYSPVQLPLSTSFQTSVQDSSSCSSDKTSSDLQSIMPNYFHDEMPASPFQSTSSMSPLSMSQNNITEMDTSSVFQNDSDFSENSLQQDIIPAGSNDPFLSELREETLVPSCEFEFIDEFLNEVNTNNCIKTENSFSPMDGAVADPPSRTPTCMPSCEENKESSLLRTLLNKGCTSPSSPTSLDSPIMCTGVFGRSTTSPPLVSPCGSDSDTCPAISLAVRHTSGEPVVSHPSTSPMCSVQVGMLNSVDVPSSTFSENDSYISDDILDFAMQYCDSIADEQARLVMHDLGQDIGSEAWPNGVDEFITTIADAQQFSNEAIDSVAALETVTATHKSVGDVRVQSSVDSSDDDADILWGTHKPVIGTHGGKKSFDMENKSDISPILTQVSSESVKLGSIPVLGMNMLQNELSKNSKVIFSTKGSQTSYGGKCISVPVTQGLQPKVVTSQNVSQKREKVNGFPGNINTMSGATSPRYTSPKATVNGRVHTEKHAGSSVSSPFIFANTKQSCQSRLLFKGNSTSAGLSRSIFSHQRPKTMTELEKHLRGYMDEEVDKFQKKQEKMNEKISTLNISDIPNANSIPFLQMLLTGELSHDKYYKIDRELRKKEKNALAKTFSSNIRS